MARGDIVVFLDDDIAIDDPAFLEAHAMNYGDPSIGGVAGRVVDARRVPGPVAGATAPAARSADPVWDFFRTAWDHMQRCDVTTAPGANMSFRRDALLAIGGVDERFAGNAFRWENDLCLRLVRAGHRVVYDPRPAVRHFYGSPGGNENAHLLGRAAGSHRWYRDFFHNHVYVALKHMPRGHLPLLLWHLYRAHVMNRPFAREGAGFLTRRHAAMVAGVLAGCRTWWRFRMDRP
jgi:GT2 family glycosyltransferase